MAPRRAGRAGGPPRLIALGGALALGVGALLAWPGRSSGPGGPPTTVVVADGSASAAATRSGYAAWLAGEVRARLEAAPAQGRAAWLVRFGRDVLVRPAAPGAPDPLEDPGPGTGASDLAGALRAAAALLEGSGEGALVLISDGTYTGGDPRAPLARLADAGTAIEAVALPPSDRSDLVLSALRLPRAPAEGAPLVGELVLGVRGAPLPAGARADVELELRGAAGTERFALEVPLGPGGALRRVDLGPARAGRTEVLATARLRGGDPEPGNDRASAVARAGSLPVVAAVAGAGARADRRADWETWCEGLAALGGLQLVGVEPGGLRALGDTVDAVVSFDLPLAEAEALGLEGFVARGGGWLATGGFELFAGPVPALSPLEPAPEPARRVLFLVDGSGSMAGAPFEELSSAVLEAMAVAPASERFELWTFTDRVESRHRLGPGGTDTADAARELLAARLPRGPTDVLAALGEVASGAGAPDTLVLVTDGRDQPDPAALAEGARELRAELEREGVALVVVGAGAERDRAALEALAGTAPLRWAGAGLTDALREELGRGRWVRGQRPRPVPDAGAHVPGEARLDVTARALARALGESTPGPLERARRARLRPGAAAVLELQDGAPVLALAGHGRGRVAVLASAPVGGFAPAWNGRPECLAPVVRALARDPEEAGPRWSEGPGGAPALAGVPAAWPVRIEARADSLPPWSLAVPAEVPGGDPLAWRVPRGALPFRPEPGAEVTLRPGGLDPQPGGAGGAGAEILDRLPWTATGNAGDDPELSLSPPRLGAIPRVGGGLAGGSPGPGPGSTASPGASPPSRPSPGAPWWVGLGLGLLILALALGWDPGRDAGAGRGPGIGEAGR